LFKDVRFLIFKIVPVSKIVLYVIISVSFLICIPVPVQGIYPFHVFCFSAAGLWIRVRIRSGFKNLVDLDPDPEFESGSRYRTQRQRNEMKGVLFSILFFNKGI
jgi:hypothetical protein